MTSEKTKIAVLGGGMGSIAAIYELTQLPENREKYDITVYQQGWRIGGKGASGRNMQVGARIEEHGLHLWFGFYDNSFKLMKDAYKEMQRSPDLPLSTFEKAFKGHDFVVLMDQYDNRWSEWTYQFAVNDKVPGEGGAMPSLWTLAWEILQWIQLNVETQIINLHQPCHQADQAQHVHAKTAWWGKIVGAIGKLGQRLHGLEGIHASEMIHIALKILEPFADAAIHELEPLIEDFESIIVFLLEKYRDWLWETYSCHLDNDTARQFLVLTDTALTWTIGLIKDDVHHEGIFSIDKYNLIDWMERHGAHAETLNGPPVRALYDNIFSYENGDVNKPNVAAGTALLWAIRMVMTYKGHIMYKMQAGMGDTVFTPFYQVLLQRDVKFKFFHCVQNLGVNGDNDAIDSIQIMPQVSLTVDQYDPLVIVKGLPCWPNQPNWDQLEDGEALRQQGINFEQGCAVIPDQQPILLEKGRDFDLVILGIPIAANRKITRELCDRNPAWQAMHEQVKTVQTRAYQVWLNQTLENLGFLYSEPPVVGTYVETTFDTYADMSHLIPAENQPAADQVQNIAYWCNAMPDTPTQQAADENAQESAYVSFTEDMPRLWTHLSNGQGQVHWDWLVDHSDGVGPARFEGQFFRANWTATERYTLSLTDTTQYRLKTNATGYENLYIVGDWIDNNFNSGCIEACSMSGMQASRAICGYPQAISGEDEDGWAQPQR